MHERVHETLACDDSLAYWRSMTSFFVGFWCCSDWLAAWNGYALDNENDDECRFAEHVRKGEGVTRRSGPASRLPRRRRRPIRRAR